MESRRVSVSDGYCVAKRFSVVVLSLLSIAMASSSPTKQARTPGEEIIFHTDFNSSTLPTELKWFEEPDEYESAVSNGQGLRVYMNAKTDFWKRTYYDPPIMKDDGHILYYPITDDKVVIETTFEINPQQQFDQAGVMIRYDGDHWIKAGIETVDGVNTVGCVVTNTYSDWSTQPWQSNQLSIRLYKLGTDYVVEIKDPVTSQWRFIRICHLTPVSPATDVMLGIMCAAPTDAGGNATFSYLTVSHTEGIEHGGS